MLCILLTFSSIYHLLTCSSANSRHVSTSLLRTSDTSLSRCYMLLMSYARASSHASVLRYSFVKSHARCVHIALERSKLNDLKVQRTLTRTSWCDGAYRSEEHTPELQH